MSRRALIYIGIVLLAALAVTLCSHLPAWQQLKGGSVWAIWAALALAASLAQEWKARAPSYQAYHPTMVFFFAGLLLLPARFFVLLVIVPHLVEWAKERLTNSSQRLNGYTQPFNVAVHIISGIAAQVVLGAIVSDQAPLSSLWVLGVCLAAVTYGIINHLLIGQALKMVCGVSWKESGVMTIESLQIDLVMLVLGLVLVVVWQINHWLVLPAAMPLILIRRALSVPQLRRDAQMDSKTGLLNARHFVEIYEAELERSWRFGRSLALVMADLDLLRNINNAYGHLAGDEVLARVGRAIRDNKREYDCAGRFGGEEFLIMLPETDMASACCFAERLRSAVESLDIAAKTSPTPIQVTMSLGVAVFPRDATTSEGLIHQADMAVYRAKLCGRNRVVCVGEMPQMLKLGVSGEDRLSASYETDYQPRPSLAGGRAEPPAR